MLSIRTPEGSSSIICQMIVSSLVHDFRKMFTVNMIHAYSWFQGLLGVSIITSGCLVSVIISNHCIQ